MKILFDTNIILDVLLKREPYNIPALHLLAFTEIGDIQGSVCATTVTTIYYLMAKTIGNSRAQTEIRKLLTLFDVAPVNRIVLDIAISSEFADYEDAVLNEAAKEIGASGIVTRNNKDFKKSSLHIYSPDELLSILEFKTQ